MQPLVCFLLFFLSAAEILGFLDAIGTFPLQGVSKFILVFFAVSFEFAVVRAISSRIYQKRMTDANRFLEGVRRLLSTEMGEPMPTDVPVDEQISECDVVLP